MIAALEAGATDAYDGMTDADIDREAGFGGHEIRCWIAACAAMRELAEANLNLQENQQRLEAMLSTIPDLIFRVDAAGVILEFHAATPNILYASPAMFLGKNVREALPPEAADVIVEALAAVTVPSFIKAGFKVGILSNFTLNGSSSFEKITGSPFR